MVDGRTVLIVLALSLLPSLLGERPSELERSPLASPEAYAPEDRQLLRLMGQGRFDDALTEGRARLESYPQGCIPYQLVVQAAVAGGQLDPFLAELREMAERNPEDDFVPVGIALARRELHQKERAWEIMADAMRSNVPCAVVYQSYIRLSQELERMDVAEATLGQLLTERPNSAYLLFARAYFWTRRGEALPALDGYQDAILKAPPLPTTLLYLSRSHRAMGNYRQAISACRVGLEVTGEGSHPEDRIALYASLGIALDRLGREDESREAFDAGLEVARAYRLGTLEALLLLEQAILLAARGESDRSASLLARARVSEDRLFLPSDRATYLRVLGRALAGLGRQGAAEDAFRECISLAAERRDPLVELDGKVNLAYLQLRRGERGAAVDAFNDVMQQATELGDAYLLSRALSGLASSQERVGDFGSALHNYRLSLEMAEKAGQLRARALAMSNMGLVYFRLGDPAQALIYSSRASDLARELGELRLVVSIQQGVAASLAGLGNLQQSERTYRAALDGASRLPAPHLQALTLAGWARVTLELGQAQEAKTGFERALILARSVDNRLVQVQALSGLGHCAWQLDDLEEATQRFEATLTLIEDTRQNLTAEGERMSYQETRAQVYSSLAAVLLRRDERQPEAGFRSKAFEVVEQSRSRVLLDILASMGEQQLGGTSSTRVVGRAPINSLEIVQSRVLQEGEILLEYSLGTRESFLWAISRDNCHVFRLPSRRDIETKVRHFLETVRNPPRSPENPFGRHQDLAKDLYRTLVGPVAPLILGSRHLIVSPDGILRHLPFESLYTAEAPEPGNYLMEIVPISYVPSAAVLRELSQRPGAQRQEFEFLGVAHPGVSSAAGADIAAAGSLSPLSLSPIPFAVDEVRSVARLFPSERRRTYLGEKATERAVKEERLERFRIVHFAAHALANDVDPERSAIFVGMDPSSEDDGMLWMGEILHLQLASDLVVLSGCQTGLGQDLNAEGTVGLSWAFLSAGSASVVVSLWNVSDRSTSELMQAFYQQMSRGHGRAEALRRAKQTVLRSERKAFRHPYYWAPFVLIGRTD